MFVKPKPGVLVRDPVSKQLLPEQGRNVQESGFWLRRIAEGSVELVKPQTTTTPELLDQTATQKDTAE